MPRFAASLRIRVPQRAPRGDPLAGFGGAKKHGIL
jgi:hypothetical protein